MNSWTSKSILSDQFWLRPPPGLRTAGPCPAGGFRSTQIEQEKPITSVYRISAQSLLKEFDVKKGRWIYADRSLFFIVYLKGNFSFTFNERAVLFLREYRTIKNGLRGEKDKGQNKSGSNVVLPATAWVGPEQDSRYRSHELAWHTMNAFPPWHRGHFYPGLKFSRRASLWFGWPSKPPPNHG